VSVLPAYGSLYLNMVPITQVNVSLRNLSYRCTPSAGMSFPVRDVFSIKGPRTDDSTSIVEHEVNIITYRRLEVDARRQDNAYVNNALTLWFTGSFIQSGITTDGDRNTINIEINGGSPIPIRVNPSDDRIVVPFTPTSIGEHMVTLRVPDTVTGSGTYDVKTKFHVYQATVHTDSGRGDISIFEYPLLSTTTTPISIITVPRGYITPTSAGMFDLKSTDGTVTLSIPVTQATTLTGTPTTSTFIGNTTPGSITSIHITDPASILKLGSNTFNLTFPSGNENRVYTLTVHINITPDTLNIAPIIPMPAALTTIPIQVESIMTGAVIDNIWSTVIGTVIMLLPVLYVLVILFPHIPVVRFFRSLFTPRTHLPSESP